MSIPYASLPLVFYERFIYFVPGAEITTLFCNKPSFLFYFISFFAFIRICFTFNTRIIQVSQSPE